MRQIILAIIFSVIIIFATGCGRIVHRIDPPKFRQDMAVYVSAVTEIQASEIADFGLVTRSLTQKQASFRKMVADVRADVADGWTQGAVDDVYLWMLKNHIYCLGHCVKTTISLHNLYNNGLKGDCKSLHFGMGAILKYYLGCPYKMEIVIYEPYIEPGFHFCLRVNGKTYDLQKWLAIVATCGLSKIRGEFVSFEIYRGSK